MTLHDKTVQMFNLLVNIISKQNKSTKHILLQWIVFSFFI